MTTSEPDLTDSPYRVLLVTRSAPYAPALRRELEACRMRILCWTDLPAEPADLHPLADADVVLLTCPHDVDTEFVTIERIRDSTPMVEIVCVCAEAAVNSAVESLRAGVYAVVCDTIGRRDLCDVICAAAARRRRAERRMRELGAGRPPARP